MSPKMNFRLPEEMLAKLKALSVETGFSVSELIRACVDRAFPYVEFKAKNQ